MRFMNFFHFDWVESCLLSCWLREIERRREWKDPLCLLSSCTRSSVLNIDWALTTGESPYRKLQAEFKRLPSWCVHSVVWAKVLKIGFLPREKCKGEGGRTTRKTQRFIGRCVIYWVPLVTRSGTGLCHTGLTWPWADVGHSDFQASECWLWRGALWISCSLIRLRKQRFGVPQGHTAQRGRFSANSL